MQLSNGSLLVGSNGFSADGLAQASPDDIRRSPSPNVIPRFFIIPERQKDGAFRDIEYLEILIPGDAKSVPCHRVDDFLRERYARAYGAWKAGQQQVLDGTPLETWLGATAQTLTLKAMHVHTVEAVAGLSDGQLDAVGMGARDLRDRARIFVSAQKSGAEAERLQSALSQRDDKIAEQDNVLAELKRRLAQLEGRPQSQQGAGAPTGDEMEQLSTRPPEGASLSTSAPPSAQRTLTLKGK